MNPVYPAVAVALGIVHFKVCHAIAAAVILILYQEVHHP